MDRNKNMSRLWINIQFSYDDDAQNIFRSLETRIMIHLLQKQYRDIFMFYSNTTYFRFTNTAHISLEELDLNFVKQTHGST